MSFAVGLILLRIFLPEVANELIELLFQVIQKISELISNSGTNFSGI